MEEHMEQVVKFRVLVDRKENEDIFLVVDEEKK